jgi:hypothetical protein
MPLLDSSGSGGATRRYQYMGTSTVSATVRGTNLLPNHKWTNGYLLAPFNPLFWGGKAESFPSGMRMGNFMTPPMGDGGLASRMYAGSAMSGAIDAIGSLSAALTGTSSVSATPNIGAQLSSTMAGTATMTGAIGGIGNLSASIEVGARPSAQDIADAVWSRNLAPFDDAGSAGLALTGAGAAGNRWSADTSTNNTPGTFGALVQKMLTVAKFLGLK